MTRWFKLDPVDHTFFDRAQYRYDFPLELAASAEQVWEGLTGRSPQSWCRMLTRVDYTSRGPHGVGATRTSEVAWGALKFREHFFDWDDANRRHAFYVDAVNLPLVRAFAEEYVVTPTASGCRFTWTFAFDANPTLSGAVKLGLPGIRWLLGSMANDTARHFGTPAGVSGIDRGADLERSN